MKSVLSAICVSACLGAGVGAATAAQSVDDAMAAYDRGDYSTAVEQLRSAAELGDKQAAQLVGFIYAIGEPTYPGVQANANEAARWLAVAASESRPAARFVVCMLAKPDAASANHCLGGASPAATNLSANLPVAPPVVTQGQRPIALPPLLPGDQAMNDASGMEPCWGMQFLQTSC